jgi:2-polyprenyl-3-methyl-5-hydroxy-6-metoxy-1,4-benzoquinol methylase
VGKDVRAGGLSPWLSRRRLEVARPFLSGRVLDFGCNNGPLADYCQKDAYLGVDINEASLDLAREEHPGFQFAHEVDDGEKFDTVAALAFIEHVPDPGAFLVTFAGLLNPGGRIVLTTPHPRMEWIHTAGAKVGAFSAHAHGEHEELIDRRRMQQLARPAGLAIEVYKRFLFGANQLFVLRPVATA